MVEVTFGVDFTQDYDCFYAAVFEAKNPALRSLPLAVQQKQIIVTCNYEARRRGLHKLQNLRDARRICPDVIIELGEDISRFRDASKELYGFIQEYSWNGRVERLGFDEVWMDVTDMVDYNMSILNKHDLQHSFFQIAKDDPTVGFDFDASTVAGHTFPKRKGDVPDYIGDTHELTLRLRLGSHLAMHLRHQVEQQKGYTSTVGIATNKLISKLVGNVNKPKGQTTMMPHRETGALNESVSVFMDEHEIGKIPGIGFKLSSKLREFVLQRAAEPQIEYGGTKEQVTVASVRQHTDIDYEKLEKLLAGPGSAHGIGFKVWCLLHGVDDSEVSPARPVPRQISIEDSYIRLDTVPELLKELNALARSLLTRMRIDLLGSDDGWEEPVDDAVDEDSKPRQSFAGMKWLAHPRTLRLSTRPRQPLQPDGSRSRTMKRISHSCPLPNFVFLLNETVDVLAEKLVRETLLTMFRKLHPEKSWWNLSLVNIAVTNMAEAASDSKTASGRDIGNMFKRQDDVLKDFRVTEVGTTISSEDEHTMVDKIEEDTHNENGQEAAALEIEDDGWLDEDGADDAAEFCYDCHSAIPAFAMVAHKRFHAPAMS